MLCKLTLYLPFRPSLCSFSILYLNLHLLGLSSPRSLQVYLFSKSLGGVVSPLEFCDLSIPYLTAIKKVQSFWILDISAFQTKQVSVFLDERTASLFSAREAPDKKAFSFSSCLDTFELKYSTAQN